VTRGGIRLTLTLFVAVLATGLLVACGDSGSTTTGSTTETTGQTAAKKQSGAQGGSKNAGGGGVEAKEDGGSQAKTGGSGGSREGAGGSGSASVSTPLRVSGGGSEQFRVKGGDNSIQEYGEETDESELQAAAEAVHGFYVARAEEDWGRACSYLANSMVQQLEQLAGQSPEPRDKGCAAVLHAFTRPLPASVRRETTVVDAGSLRREDERGFLIYYDSEHQPYAIALEDEDGAWKLTLLSGTPLG
jgi:hypothetical protein